MNKYSLDQYFIDALNTSPSMPIRYSANNIECFIAKFYTKYSGAAPDNAPYDIIIEIQIGMSSANIYIDEDKLADAINYVYQTQNFNTHKLKALVNDIQTIGVPNNYRLIVQNNQYGFTVI